MLKQQYIIFHFSMNRRSDNNITSGLHYGHWCGPGWSANQAKDSKDLTTDDFDVPAIDALDQACKNHDIGLHFARTREDVARVNEQFRKEATEAGILGTVFAFLVTNLGPTEPGTSFINLPCRSDAKKTAGNATTNIGASNNETLNMRIWKNYDKTKEQINLLPSELIPRLQYQRSRQDIIYQTNEKSLLTLTAI